MCLAKYVARGFKSLGRFSVPYGLQPRRMVGIVAIDKLFVGQLI